MMPVILSPPKQSPGPLRPEAESMIAATDRAFPNIDITSARAAIRGTVTSRVVARRPVIRVETPGLVVEGSRARAARAGMSNYVKMVWQISGEGRFEDARSTFELRPGDAALLPMSSDYQFEMADDYISMMLVFDPADDPGTAGLIQQNLCRKIAGDSAVTAAGAVVGSLLDSPSTGVTDDFAVDAAINLVCRSILETDKSASTLSDQTPARLRRARTLVEAQIGDPGFGPAELARELGVSRRSLYADFAQLGFTPAAFIRRVRLARARQDIIVSREVPDSLTQIALRNGFVDSSGFSRAFKAEFGVSPSVLRSNG